MAEISHHIVIGSDERSDVGLGKGPGVIPDMGLGIGSDVYVHRMR